jgi:hypothetical protein
MIPSISLNRGIAFPKTVTIQQQKYMASGLIPGIPGNPARKTNAKRIDRHD